MSVKDRVAFHYDSLHPSNRRDADLASRQLSQLLGHELKFLDLDDSPQQENGSDCGVFVCVVMKHLLLRRLLKADAGEKISMSMGGKHVDASGGRKEMVKVIDGFRREGERRQGYVFFQRARILIEPFADSPCCRRSRSPFSRSPSTKGKSRSPPRVD